MPRLHNSLNPGLSETGAYLYTGYTGLHFMA